MSNQTTNRNEASKSDRKEGSMDPGEAAGKVANEAKSKANEVKDKVVDESKRAKDELTEQAQGFFDELKEALSDQVGRVSKALRGTERQFEEQRLENLARVPGKLADGIDDVSEYMRERSGRGLRKDFEKAIANQPMLIAGGLAVVGAALAWTLRKDRPDVLSDIRSAARSEGSENDEGDGRGRGRRGGQ